MSFLGSLFGGAQSNYKPAGTPEAATNFVQSEAGLNDLAQSLKQQAAGGGPNLANQLLQNATGQNVANQAALMAGQRGAAQNVGLMARQAAQQGGALQQQAAGQAAVNRLQQQLAAQQQLGNVLGTQGQLASGVMNANNQILAKQAQENASRQGNLLGGIGGMLGGMLPGIGSAVGGLFKGGGGGGIGHSQFQNDLSNETAAFMGAPMAEGGQAQQPMQSSWQQNFLMGIKPQGSPQMMAQGGLPFMPHDYKHGGNVVATKPSEKAVKSGNSYSNDKIPAMLSEGEIVIPRDVVQTGDPQAAAHFVSQVMSGKHRKKK